jgi:cytochrome c-type biogenesis protein CcmH/NrfG
MHQSRRTSRAAAATTLTLLLALAAFNSGCGGDARTDANGGEAAQAGATPGAAAGPSAPADIGKLNAEIARLEKEAERNPADEETRDQLARVYVRRGNALRGAGQLREALTDYQSALRLDPDSDDAQAGAAAATGQLGGEKEDENGAPAPLPITPNVADEEGKASPTPTPKKQ